MLHSPTSYCLSSGKAHTIPRKNINASCDMIITVLYDVFMCICRQRIWNQMEVDNVDTTKQQSRSFYLIPDLCAV